MKTSNATQPAAAKAPVLTLPQWSQAERAAPNVLLRGLFKALAVGNHGAIPAEKPELLLNTPKLSIRYSGPILAQPELDVWQAWLDIASRQGSMTIRCSNAELLAALGRDDSGTQYEKLKIQIRKLVSALPEVTAGTKIEMNNLATASYDTATKLWEIRLNPYIATLFRTYGYTRVNIAERRSMADAPLAQWLHIFFATHELAAPYPLSRLQALSGRPARNFVRDVKLAVDALKRSLPTTESTETASKEQAERKGWHIELINAGTARRPEYLLHMNKRGLTAAEVAKANADLAAAKRATQKRQAARSAGLIAVPTKPAAPVPAPAATTPTQAAVPTWVELLAQVGGIFALLSLDLVALKALATLQEQRAAAAQAAQGMMRGSAFCYDERIHLIAGLRYNRDAGHKDLYWNPLDCVDGDI
jgi:hypothetical protein